MDRKEAAELSPIIQAFSEGKDIETKTGSGWISIENMSFAGNPDSYRIKLEPKYRPFKDAEECWQEMQKHKYFGWIKGKDASIPSRFMIINSVRDEEVSITSGIDFTYSELVEYYTFVDGTPFGVKVEE